MILGIGTDIVEISRVERAIGRKAFLDRVYTEEERCYCEGRGTQRAASYAVRFAAKEAILKALGTGLREGKLREVEVINDALGKPLGLLHGSFARLAHSMGVTRLHITLSHAREYATAVCILEGEEG